MTSATILGAMQTKRPGDTCFHLNQHSLIQMTYVPTHLHEMASVLSQLPPKRGQTRRLSRCPIRQALVRYQVEKDFSASETSESKQFRCNYHGSPRASQKTHLIYKSFLVSTPPDLQSVPRPTRHSTLTPACMSTPHCCTGVSDHSYHAACPAVAICLPQKVCRVPRHQPIPLDTLLSE